MNLTKRAIAAAELLLVSPAVLFMTALFVRNLQPLRYEPAHTAQRIVDWYAVRPRLGLWVLIIVLLLVVLATGCATVLRSSGRSPMPDQQANSPGAAAFTSDRPHGAF